jgi:lipopolysaccharide transport system ATP-binding protein
MFSLWLRRRAAIPTLLHFTHAKAGSTWIDGILRHLFSVKVMPRFGAELFPGKSEDASVSAPATRVSYEELFRGQPFCPGHVYPGLFLTRQEFELRPEFADARRFVVIRDLRDTITSHYFSLKKTHVLDVQGRVKSARDFLQASTKEEGFVFLFDRDLARFVDIQRSWLESNEIVVKYEDLILDDVAQFDALFRDRLGLKIPARHIRSAVAACRFENVFGRKLGQLDEKAHGRQGLPGDWKNHFTPELRRIFHERTGDLLIAAGYEKDNAWVGDR